MTVQQIQTGLKVVYESPTRVLVGIIVGIPEWRKGTYIVPFQADGVNYIGDIRHLHLESDLKNI